MVKACRYALLVCAFSMGADLAHAAARIIPDRTTVSLNESFQLRFEYEGGFQGKPDWQPLKRDFHIRGVGEQSRVEVAGGKRKTVRVWTLQLQPKKTGMLTIPPVRFGGEKSEARQIRVVKPAKARRAKFYIEMEAIPRQAYVQEEILVRVRVFMAHALRGSITPFTVRSGQAIIKKGEEKRYRRKIEGRQYEVYEIAYLCYPQVSGKLALDGVRLKGQYSQGGRRIGVNKQGKPMNIDVLPVPQQHQRSAWLPARKVSLTEAWEGDLDDLQVGTPFTRRVTLQAEGVRGEQLPALNLGAGDAFKTYKNIPERASKMQGNRVVGISRVDVVMIPARAGESGLPEIRVPWWNTGKRKMEWATLAPHVLNVAEAPEAAILTLEEPVSFEMERDGERGGAASYWVWLSMAFLALWVMTGAAWVARWPIPFRRRLQESAPRVNESARAARRQLKKACERGDAPAARDALRAWMKAVGAPAAGGDDPAMDAMDAGLAGMGARYGDELAGQIALLDRHLYAPESDASEASDASDAGAPIRWDGKALWRAFAAIPDDEGERDGRRNGASAAAPAAVLQSLYPAAAPNVDGER